MGGYGSGRSAYRQKAEHCQTLDVNRFHREGCLAPGRMGAWVWSRNGEEAGRIGYAASQGKLTLNYKVRSYGDDWETVVEPICIAQVNCHYGGTRPYFICPGIVSGRHCARRVGKLFLGGRYFLCRHCYNIGYSSQSEERYDRMLRRANKLRMALGGEPGTASWIAPRPKGMWRRTYQRALSEIERCEGQADQLFLSKFAQRLSAEELERLFG